MKFTQEELLDGLCVTCNGSPDCDILSETILDKHRWYHDVEVVFRVKATGRCFKTIYCSYTGDEPGDPWFSDPVECQEVVPVTKMVEVTTYEPVV